MDSNKETTELRSDEALAELLSKAPPRMVPPKSDEQEIRRVVHAELQKVIRQDGRRRHTVSFALAASVLLAVFAGLNLLRNPLPDFESLQLASIERQFGDISIATRGPADSARVAAIEGGDIVETGNASGFALAWHGGGTLRADENTVVVFEAENQIYLREGRVYFDSVNSGAELPQSDAREFLIRTDSSIIRHIGTQYMTEVSTDGTTVSVREGIVSVAGAAGSRRALTGQQLAISGSGTFSVNEISGHDDEWQWIMKTTPPINLDGRPVSQALNWVSRESGLSVVYASEAAESLADQTELRGMQSELDLQPTRALELFMMTVDLEARIDDGSIVVSAASESD
jgi:hypothetical protein